MCKPKTFTMIEITHIPTKNNKVFPGYNLISMATEPSVFQKRKKYTSLTSKYFICYSIH